MSTTIYFVRHGEVKNPKNIWYGRLPRFGLTERGKAEIGQTAEFFSDKHIDAVYSSPLFRARQTATIIAEKLHIKPIHYSDDLLEVQSSLEGSPFEHMQKIHFNIYPSKENAVKGESIADVANRLQNFILNMSNKYAGKNIISISHGDVLMIMRALGKKLPLEFSSLRPENGYVNHGEVYAVTFERGRIETFRSVFKPGEKSS